MPLLVYVAMNIFVVHGLFHDYINCVSEGSEGKWLLPALKQYLNSPGGSVEMRS